MKNNEIDIGALMPLGISNLQAITENSTVIGIRGQTLSAAKNHKYLKAIKAAGVDTVIDLRAADYSDYNVRFIHACKEVGLEYRHFPVDKSHTSDTVIIKNLPMMIDIIDRGGFYIACAHGLHRTDIALALNFLFNPKAQEPPIMHGHLRNGKFRCDDIFGRAHSIYRSLTAEDKNTLGWNEAFDKSFVERKRLLTAMQEIIQS